MSNPAALPPLEELFRTHADFVFRICMRYTKNREEAEDQVQDVFVKIHHTSGSFKGQSSLSTWIYRISVNCCLDYLRTQKRHQELDARTLAPAVAYNLTGFDDQALARVELGRILSSVRPLVRQVLFLALAEGVSYAEIAAMLGLKKSAVAKTVERFLTRHRKKGGTDESGRSGGHYPSSVPATGTRTGGCLDGKALLLCLVRTAASVLLSTLDRLFPSNMRDGVMRPYFHLERGAW